MISWNRLTNVLVVLLGVTIVLAFPRRFFPSNYNCSTRCNSEVTFKISDDAVIVDSDGPIGIQGEVLDSPFLNLGKTYAFKSWDLETATLKKGQVVTFMCSLYTQKSAEQHIRNCSLRDQTVSTASP
ncbi:hypothetical protein KBC70_00630, partial [Candidatus Woesebacteria bacterium]|nr:hypothetical protein [Candidatus Woesebacteria bacterium]